jgi:hypothetical protein
MFSLRGGSRVWSLILILCFAGSFVLSSAALAGDNDVSRFAGDNDVSRFAGDNDVSRFAGDNDVSRFAGDNDVSRFSPLSFGSVTAELINIASTEVITRAACAVLGYKAFSSIFDARQNTVKAVNIEPVNKPEFSKNVLTAKMSGCNLLLDIGL